MPVRLLRMLPASLPVSFLNRAGGAKSSVVYMPDFRIACLKEMLVLDRSGHRRGKAKRRDKVSTYGLGMAARSSKEDTKGV